MLLIGLSLAIHQRAFSTAKVWSAAAGAHLEAMGRSAVREMMRPLLAEAMVDFENSASVPLNGTPVVFHYGGREFVARVQDVDGLIDLRRTPIEAWAGLLPPESGFSGFDTETGNPTFLTIFQGLAVLGVPPERVYKLSEVFTLDGTSRHVDSRTLSVKLRELADIDQRWIGLSDQPEKVVLSIQPR